MDLTTYLNQQGHGAMSDLGRLIGAPPQTIRDWSIGRRLVPDYWCPTIEIATSGAVTCESLRSDLLWLRAKDPSWPNPNGRPTRDFPLRLSIHSSSAGQASTASTPITAAVQTAQKEPA